MVPDSWDDDTSDESNHHQLESTRDVLYTLRVSPSLCNLGPRAPSVDRLPGIARSGEGYTGGSTWSGDQTETPQQTRTSARVKSKNVKHVDFIRFTDSDEEGDRGMLADDGGKVPKNAIQALKDDKWKTAMEEEYKSLMDNRVWTLVCKTKKTESVNGKWCFTLKYGPDGQVTKHKARYVARGFTQIRGRGFDETYVYDKNSTRVGSTAKNDAASVRHKDGIPKRGC